MSSFAKVLKYILVAVMIFIIFIALACNKEENIAEVISIEPVYMSASFLPPESEAEVQLIFNSERGIFEPVVLIRYNAFVELQDGSTTKALLEASLREIIAVGNKVIIEEEVFDDYEWKVVNIAN